jgi:predicted nuclease of predicted toxin-antitoxin system
MKILANEKFPRSAVDAMRSAGHDVLWARTEMAGVGDDEILRRAQSEGRIVVSFDKDFGELAFRWGLPASCGVILFRFVVVSPELASRRVIEALDGGADWSGHFAVVDEFRVRLRALP